MPDLSALRRASVALLTAGALFLAVAPAAAADDRAGPASASARITPTHAAAPAATPTRVDLHGDSHTVGSARGGVATWNLTTLYYYETIPSKWDWSLSTAVAKWNGSGGKIKLVRTPYKARARVFISYGSTGGAAGMATVGATPGAWVHLNPSYNTVDSLNVWRQVEVMALFTHEIGHVLGFQHTSASCSLMRPVLDISTCYMAPVSLPGQYRCRVVDPALVLSFVRAYGGAARYPGSWCLVDPLPSQLSGVTFSGGTSAPVGVRWARPTYLPSGSRVEIRVWKADSCTAMPSWAASSTASPTALTWADNALSRDGTHCYRVNLVNRYGAGRTATVRALAGW